MDDTNNSIEETLTQDTEAEIEIDLDDNQDDEQVDWKAEAEKKAKAYEDQKKRAEIAEDKLKKGSSTTKPVSSKEESGLSIVDTIALTKSNIDADDIGEVIEYSRFKKISVSEALKSSALKAILAEKNEKRTVAQASHSGTSRRSTSKLSDESILNNAKNGILPESDEDFERLAELRMNKKR